jgi:hypothetical protein
MKQQHDRRARLARFAIEDFQAIGFSGAVADLRCALRDRGLRV